MGTPFDERSNTSKSESTDESVLSSVEDRISYHENLEESDSKVAVYTDVDSEAIVVSSHRSSLCSNKMEVGCSMQEVSSPGCYGEVTVEHSSDIHFGNKIYTAPITVVNHLPYPENVASSGTGDKNSWTDPFARPVWQRQPKRASNTFRWSTRRLVVAVASIVVITVSSALATVFIVLGGWSSTGTEPLPDDILINASWFYTRDEWQAKPPKRITLQTLPLPYVIIEHTVTPACETHEACVNQLVSIQNTHMFLEHNWDDIAYNYMVGGGEGGVYVGRGANAVGAHAKAYNSHSIGVGFLGNYDKVAPSDLQMAHVAELIQEAVRQGKLIENYQVFGHCQVSSFRSPGRLLMAEVRKMPNWNSTDDCIFRNSREI